MPGKADSEGETSDGHDMDRRSRRCGSQAIQGLRRITLIGSHRGALGRGG